MAWEKFTIRRPGFLKTWRGLTPVMVRTLGQAFYLPNGTPEPMAEDITQSMYDTSGIMAPSEPTGVSAPGESRWPPQ